MMSEEDENWETVAANRAELVLLVFFYIICTPFMAAWAGFLHMKQEWSEEWPRLVDAWKNNKQNDG